MSSRDDMLHAITNPMMNANAIGAAQGSILGQGITSQDAYNYAAAQQGRRVESWFDYQKQTNFQVINADNGFVIIVKPDHPGSKGRMLVASTIEEVRDLITSEMVARKMEK